VPDLSVNPLRRQNFPAADEDGSSAREGDMGTRFSLLARIKRSAPAAGLGLAVLAAGIGLAGPAQAAGTAKPVVLAGVSCVRPTWCMAVGTALGAHNAPQNLAEIWNGTSWRLVATPSGTGLARVACSATWYCLAFGEGGRNTPAFRWNGRIWLKIPEPRGASSVPSCASRTMCIVGNGYEQSVLSWNGKKWTDTQLCGASASAQCITSTSCASTSFCMAVGTVKNEIYNLMAAVAVWDGKHWSNLYPPDVDDEGTDSSMDMVSCAGQVCLMLGSTDYAWDNTTKTWQDVSPTSEVSGGARALSCSSGTDCMTVGGYPANAWWHDGTWTDTENAPSGKNPLYVAVSCKSGSCVAVGYHFVGGKPQPLAESWNGTAWKFITPKSPAR
jgi:hypothetical protein